MNISRVIALGAALCLLSACMIVVDKDSSSSYQSESWEVKERQNRQHIATLSEGRVLNDVVTLMGAPDFDENLRLDNGQYRVLYYRTQRVTADGKTTKDECTPLVFEQDTLIGWGHNQLNVLLQSPARNG